MSDQRKRRIGVYGGTFSPPHLGHMHAVQAFLSSGLIDHLLVVPTFVTPLKAREEATSPEDRFEMCRLAFGSLPEVTVSEMEIRRAGKSYTSETLTQLSEPDVELSFLCGTDMLLTMGTWHDPTTIFRLARIVCIRRENDQVNGERLLACAEEYRREYNADVCFLTVPPLPLSSSEIRTALKAGADVSAYLLPAVEAYIKERRLYL